MRLMKSITFTIVAHTSRETLPRNIIFHPAKRNKRTSLTAGAAHLTFSLLLAFPLAAMSNRTC
jgi:hypothetical protein